MSEQATQTKETISLPVTAQHLAMLKDAAHKEGISVSRRIRNSAVLMSRPANDATVRAWLYAAQRTPTRDATKRTSTILDVTELPAIVAAAKRLNVTKTRWLHVVALGALDQPAAPQAEIAPSSDLDRETANLLARTFAAIANDPSKAALLAEQMRARAGLMPGDKMTPDHVHKAAKAVLGYRDNVVPLFPSAPAATYHPPTATASEAVIDKHGNKATIKTFGSVEKATQALATLRDCRNCIDCVDCDGCSDCRQCGQCSHCSYCVGVIGGEGQHGVNRLD